MTAPLRVAAIDFLNPAPLMWDFEHPPLAESLRERYRIEKMSPAACAAALAAGTADLGLIPIGAYATTRGLMVLPGCAIASLGPIRSLLLVIRTEDEADDGEEPDLAPPTRAELAGIRTVALDTGSRTSALYTQILFRRFWEHTPRFVPHGPELDAMLGIADAALLIGDPALCALRDRTSRRAHTGERLRYLDMGQMWNLATGTAWVSAFWAIRSEALAKLSPAERAAVLVDFAHSRDAGLAHIPELVEEWAPRLGIRPETVRTYLTWNIRYTLDAPALAGVNRFFVEAHGLGLLAAVPPLVWAA